MGVLTFRNFGILERLVASGYLELIEDIEVTGSSVTSVQFSGFTATKEDTLVLVSDINNTSANGSLVRIYANNNQVATNYWKQELYATSTTVGGGRENSATVGLASTLKKTFILTNIKLTNDGYVTYQLGETRTYGTSLPLLVDAVVSSTFTATSITQLDVNCNQTNAIGIGSRFQLYKIVGV